MSNKFCRNLLRWKIAIESAINKNQEAVFPASSELPSTINSLCIVEVKKLNEENRISRRSEILEYAKKDKDLLKEQIDILNPQIVVCCGDIEWYDKIYNAGDYETEEELAFVEKCSCWLLDNRFVISFFHPSTRHKSDKYLFDILVKLMTSTSVQENISKTKK